MSEAMISAQNTEEFSPAFIDSIIVRLKAVKSGKEVLYLPIKTIQKLEVDVEISYEDKEYKLDITPTFMPMRVWEPIIIGTNTTTPKALRESIIQTMKTLKNLRINKYYAQLESPDHQRRLEEQPWPEFFETFKDQAGIRLEVNECCVCFSVTKTETNCRHTVCLECLANLMSISADDVPEKKCPMCRESITTLLRI